MITYIPLDLLNLMFLEFKGVDKQHRPQILEQQTADSRGVGINQW